MSSRRSRQSSGSSRFSDDIVDVTKLQELLPLNHRGRSNGLSVSQVLDEICNYIRELQRQVEDRSEQISDMLATIDSDTPQASATVDSDTPQASATVHSDTPQASATIDSDTPQASTARSSIIPDRS